MKSGKAIFKILCAAMALVFATVSVTAVTGAPVLSPLTGERTLTATPLAAVPTVGASVKKSETVYVNLDAQGNVREQIVTDWIHSDTPNITVPDRSNLRDIQNIKGDAAPQQRGNDLVWQLEGNDLYYRGKSDGTLPVQVRIAYRLDGKQVSPDEMAGKSGRVQIDVDFKNTQKHNVDIGGKVVPMYTPMMAVAALSFPDDVFQNVTLSDGQLIADGNNQMAALIAMPGLQDSLSLESYPDIKDLIDVDFVEHFTITADAREFEMGPIMLVVTAGVPDLEELDAADDIDDMRLDLYDLRDMQDDLNRADPNYRTRSLFTDPAVTGGARILVDDIFDFYDLDTRALDILPKYVTDENVALLERVNDDMDEAAIDELLDSDAMQALLDRMTARNIDKISALLDDYDEIKKVNDDDLDRMIAETKSVLQILQQNEGNLQTMGVLMGYASQFLSLAQAMSDPTVQQMLHSPQLAAALQGLVSDSVAGYMAMLSAPAANAAALKGLVAQAAAGNPQIARLQPVLDFAIENNLLGYTPQQILAAAGGGVTLGASAQPAAGPFQGVAAPSPAPAPEQEDDENTVQSFVISSPTLKEGLVLGGGQDGAGKNPQDAGAGGSESGGSGEGQEAGGNGGAQDTGEAGTGEGLPDADSAAPESGGITGGEAGEADGAPAGEYLGGPGQNGGQGQGQENGANTILPTAPSDGAGQDEERKPQQEEEGPLKETAEESAQSAALYSAPTPYAAFPAGSCGEIMVGIIGGAGSEMGNKLTGLLTSLGQLQNSIEADLGGTQAAQKKLQDAISFSQAIIPELQKLMASAAVCVEQMTHNDRTQMEYLLQKTEDLIEDLRDNEDNIYALKRVIREYDSDKMEDFRDNYRTLIDDFDDLRPILRDLRDELDDQDINDSFHQSPKTTEVLLRMKNDLLEYRNVSEILRESVAPATSTLLGGVFNTFDRLQAKGAVDKYTGQVDDADALLDRKDAIVSLSDQYRLYTDAPEYMDTEIKFIMKTDEIKKPEPPEEAPPAQKKQGFLDWAKGLLGKNK